MPMPEQNEAFANRCRCLMNAINALSRLGVVVREVEPGAQPLPVVWVYCAPALYRGLNGVGTVHDIGHRTDGRVKSADCLGCEVRWLEPMALTMAKQAARLGGRRHARA